MLFRSSDTAAIKSASEKLNEVWQTASAELYKAAQAQAGAAPGAKPEGEPAGAKESAKKDEGPIIDAEVVDEKK